MQCLIDGGELRRSSRYVFKSSAFRSIYTRSHIYKCSLCGLRQVDVGSVDNERLTEYYRHTYREVAKIGVADSEADHEYYRARGVALAELIHNKPKRVFELGAGYGYNLRAVKARFPDAELFTDELDTKAIAGVDVQAASLGDGPYDAVILSHVLEHFTDPIGLLEDIRNSVTKDGAVIIEVPNDVEGIMPINGPDEPHLTFFTAETLRRLLEKTGFKIEDVFTAGPDLHRRNLKNRLKGFARNAAKHSSLIKNIVDRKRLSTVSRIDLTQRNPGGILLRAKLTA